jgi:hypothetical protein
LVFGSGGRAPRERFSDWAVVTVDPRRVVAPLLRRTMSTDATFGRWKT